MPKIEVKDATGGLLAVFDKEYAGGSPEEYNYDCVKDAEIDIELNGDCLLTFKIPAVSEKLQYLTPENLIYCDGREFVLADPDNVEHARQDGRLWAEIRARESWNLLAKQHKTICNDSNALPVKDLDVVITPSGTAAGGYAAGSAGSALSWLLANSGWTLDVVDVIGTHEIRTSQESILDNVKKVLELWGGYQVWNSVSHKLSHRATSWEPYNGYQIRLAKNHKGVTRTYNYDVVTKLWVYGQNDVDIFDVNTVHSGTAQGGGTNTITLAASAVSVSGAYIDGVVYITGGTGAGQSRRIIDYNGSTKIATVESSWTAVPDNTSTYEIKARFLLDFGYLSQIRSGVWRNQDITDPSELRLKAQEIHADLAYPRVNYSVEQVDLRTLADYSHETFSVGDLVDVIDEEMNIAVQVRIIRHRYNVFRPWECSIELGDKSYELKSILAEIEKQRRVAYRVARVPASLVVADGLTSRNTRRADFIVPPGSTSAQDTVNNAINSLRGYKGKVTLLEGNYIVSNSILLPDDVTLELLAGAIIKVKDNLNAAITVIRNKDYTNGNDNIAVIGEGTIDGNKANQTAEDQKGILFKAFSNTGKTGKIKGITVKNFRYEAINLLYYSNAHVEETLIKDNGYHGILATYCKGVSIVGNKIFSSELGSGIRVSDSSSYVNISDNTCEGNGEYGIYAGGYAGFTISNNIVRLNKKHGLYVEASRSATISGNQVEENSQLAHNTYDGIHLTNNADYCNIQKNTVRRGEGTIQQRYGIRINSSNCDSNLVTNNDLYNAGATANFSDAGTGTVVTAGNRGV